MSLNYSVRANSLMITYIMEPTTFEESLVDFANFPERLEKFIRVEQCYISGSLVIGLNARFGAGKSTFLEMWSNRLAEQEVSDEKPLIVRLNTWQDDYCGEPLISLVSELIEALGPKEKCTEKLQDALQEVGWFIMGIGNQLAHKWTGFDAVASGDFAKKKKDEREEHQTIPKSFFEAYGAKKKAMETLKSAIESVLKDKKQTIWIFVDELDRCRPDYAVSFLETIKHIFDISGVVFILAVDRSQLECVAKAKFGTDLDFPEYYRKFVHREVSLPKPEVKDYGKFVSKYIDDQLKHDQKENIVELINAMKLTPRQIQEIFRIIGHLLEIDKDSKARLNWCYVDAIILMSVLRLGKPAIYEALGREEFGVRKAGNFFKKELKLKYAYWWFILYYSGKLLGRGKYINVNPHVHQKAGFSEKDIDFNVNISEWERGWGRGWPPETGRFRLIYTKIEEAVSWI